MPALLKKSKNLPLAALVGLPVAVDGLLYNCAALVCQGRLVGVVPKIYLPNYREFYEGRQFTPGDTARQSEITLAGQKAPFGTELAVQGSSPSSSFTWKSAKTCGSRRRPPRSPRSRARR